MYAFHLTLHKLCPVKDVPPINETSIKSAGFVTQNKRQPTFFHHPQEMWLKRQQWRRQKQPPAPQNPTQDRRIKLYCLTSTFPFLFDFLLKCWQFNTWCFQSTSTSYVVFIIILEVNWAGIIISIPDMREWAMDLKCKTVAVLSGPDTSFPAFSFPGVMATVCSMECGH